MHRKRKGKEGIISELESAFLASCSNWCCNAPLLDRYFSVAKVEHKAHRYHIKYNQADRVKRASYFAPSSPS